MKYTYPNDSFLGNNLIYVFLPVLGLCCCSSLPLVVASGSRSLVAVRALLVAVVSLVAAQATVCGFRQLRLPGSGAPAQCCGACAYLPRGMWDLPRPGDPTLGPCVGRGFFSTELQGKPPNDFLYKLLSRGVTAGGPTVNLQEILSCDSEIFTLKHRIH